MFGKLKALGAILLAGITITGSTALATKGIAKEVIDDIVESGIYKVENGESVLSVDRENLNLKIERGDKVWYSGKRQSENDDLNGFWVNKLTDGVTVGYRAMKTLNAKEEAMSDLRPSIKFKERSDGFDADVKCRKVNISFTLQVRLKDNALQVKVPFDSIAEENAEENKLEYLMVYPFFDSSYSLVDGGILIPDGSGGVIDLSEQTSATQRYSARIFGDDYSISTKKLSPTSPENATMPLFALMYNDHGTMVTADSGAEYCSINAYASGITTNYNFAHFNWIYREPYVKYYESSGTEGRSYQAFQENLNKFDLIQTMTLFDGGCDYVNIASEYRKKVDIKKSEKVDNAGLRLQFLMAENKSGMFGDEVVVMTKTSDVSNVVDEVSGYCKNLKVSLLGYTAGGLNGSYPNHFPLDGGTGSNSSYKKLYEKVKGLGGELAFATDYARAYKTSGVDNRKLALNISNQFAVVEDSRTCSFGRFNMLNPQDGMDLLQKDLKNIKKYTDTLDYSSICSLLYSGYKSKDFSRVDAVNIFKEGVANTMLKANMVKPNSYMWSSCNSYLDAPISSSGFMIVSYSVPFLQTLLSGSMQLYSAPVNLNYTGDDLILRLIDYNVYPSFLLTQKDSIELFGTSSTGLFTSAYEIWKDTIKDIYFQVDEVLSKVANCSIVERKAENGLQVTTYSNNKQVVVNYSFENKTFGGVQIKAKTACIVDKA